MANLLQSKNLKYLGYLFVLLYLLPLVLLGQDAYMQIFDNLDGEVVNRLLLKRNGAIYNFDKGVFIPQIMNGIPRSFFPSGINLSYLLVYLFDDVLTSYIINAVLVHSLAFWGMYLLLTKLDDKENYLIKTLASLCFAILPHLTNYGLAITGIPFLAYAFINLFERQRIYISYLILCFFPFYTYNFLILPFVVLTVAIVFIYQWIKTKRFSTEVFLGGTLLVAAYLIVDIQMILSVFDTRYVSHRSDFHFDKYYSSFFFSGFTFILTNFFHHTKISEFCLQLGVNLAAIWYLIKYKKFNNPLIKKLYIANLVIVIFWAINMTSEFHILKANMGFLKHIHLSRFSFFLPASWYVIFFLILKEMYERTNKYTVPLVFGALQILIILSSHTQVTMMYKRVLGLNFNTEKEITYRQFYSANLFKKINDHIGRDQATYRVVSVGLYPSIALFNGFYTLDNYQSSYFLSYKKSFREVIADELDKSPEYKNDFDNWGHFCMISSSELPFKKQRLIPKNKGSVIKNLQIDTNALKKMGAEYIFSSVEIKNYKLLNLKYHGTFEDEASPWKIFLYELN